MVVAATGLILTTSPGTAADSDIVPITPYSMVPEGKIIMSTPDSPKWKTMWDEARQLALSGEYEKAIQHYNELLVEKKNLSEARWELARLQIHLKKWDDAALLLELLIEEAPDQSEYLNALGQIMWEKGRLDRAVDLFGRAYEKKPDDKTALAGLVECFVKLNKKDQALPFMEKLYALSPKNPGVRRYLAFLALDLNEYKNAASYLADLAKDKDADLEILRRAAQVHERLGRDTAAQTYWQRILVKIPSDLEANSKLAAFYEKKVQPAKALPLLLTLLAEKPNDVKLLGRIGSLYSQLGKFKEARPFYELYLQHFPDDHDVLRAMVTGYAVLGDQEKTLKALAYYFAIDSTSEPENQEMTLKFREEINRYNRAIPLYRQLIKMSKSDTPETLSGLVNDILAISENKGKVFAWREIAEISSDPLPLYRSMAGLLEELGRTEELGNVLGLINKLVPGDGATSLKLARIRLEQGDLGAARKLFDKLTPSDKQSFDFFSGRGLLLEKMKLYSAALRDYEALLASFPGRKEIRGACVRLAGKLGMVERMFFHLDNMSAPENRAERVETNMIKAQALEESGFYHESMKKYEKALKETADFSGQERIRLNMASLLGRMGLYFEAEQMLRKTFLQKNSQEKRFYLEKLFELSLEAGRLDDAEIWLDELQAENSSGHAVETEGKEKNTDFRLGLLRAQLLWKEGYRRAATKAVRNLLEMPVHGEEADLRVRASFDLGRFLLLSAKLEAAEEIGNELLDLKGDKDIETFVLLEQVYGQLGEITKRNKMSAQILLIAEKDLKTTFDLAKIYERYNDYKKMYETGQLAFRKEPGSLQARFIMARALKKQGELRKSFDLVEKIAADFPGNTRAENEALELAFRTGRFEQVLTRCEDILTADLDHPEIILLKARTLWALQRWPEAIKIYQSFLDPSIRETLISRIKDNGFFVDLRSAETILGRLTSSKKDISEFSAEVMSPSFFLKKSAYNDFAVPLYARYQWQERFLRELAARRAVARREYHKATKLYEGLLEDYPEDESLLFDLGGINNRLGRLGMEAALYEELSAINHEYPGLDEAVQRNSLKRRPKLALQYGLLEKKGWDNYLAIQKNQGDMELWFAPWSLHEMSVTASRIKYLNPDGKDELLSRRIGFSYKSDLLKSLSVSLTGGAENPEGDIPSTNFFSCEFLGGIGDLVTSQVLFSRDVVTDTIASITRSVTQEKIGAGLAVDLHPRLMVGGDYEQKKYSDDNQANSYKFWSSYTILWEPTLLNLFYSYDYCDSQYGPSPVGIMLADGFTSGDHPYWSPEGEYWQNKITFSFKHQLSSDKMKRGTPKYYTLEYSIGHDSEGNSLQDIKGGFLMEFTRHFVVEASAEAARQGYASREFLLSGSYIW